MKKQTFSRRQFLRLSALATGGALIAACTPQQAAEEAEQPAEKAEQPQAVESKEMELSAWLFSLTPEIIDYINGDVIPEFQEQYPKATVSFEHVPYDGYRQKLTTATVGGGLPDLHECGTQAAGRAATSGEGLPIDDYIDTWDDAGDYFEPNWQGCRFAGYTWGVPIYSSPSMVLYWKSKFEEAGLDPEKPPVNDVEYIEYAEKLQKVDGNKIVQLGGWSPSDWKGFFQAFEVELQRLGGQMADEEYKQVLFNSDKGLAALTWIVELFQQVYPEGVARLPDEAPIPHFANQNIAMHMRAHGSECRNVKQYNPDVWDDLGFADPLQAKEGEGRKVGIAWRNFITVAPTSVDAAAAAELAHVFTGPVHNVKYNEFRGDVPVRQSAMDADYVKNSDYLSKYLEMGSPNGYDVINPPGYFELREAGGNHFEAAALGKISIEEGLQECAKVWEEGLDQAPPIKVP
jgi:ABC-type glycerol-3-phosphate transport system substrate-binding protein